MKPTRRVHKRRRTRRGGKKLGEGKYGFVIDPAIPCEGKDVKGYVSKVFMTKEEFHKINKKVIETIKTIPDYEKYFILPEFCENVGEPSEENMEDGVTKENKRNSYLMRRGEETLATRIKDLISDPEYYSEQELEKFMLHDLKDMFIGLHLLHEKNILHGDLHTENILVNWVKQGKGEELVGLYRFIDFDRAFFVTDKDKKSQYVETGWNHIPSDEEAKSNEFGALITDIVKELGIKDEIYITEQIYSMLGSLPGSRTGGAAHRSSRRNLYRSRRVKGSSRR